MDFLSQTYGTLVVYAEGLCGVATALLLGGLGFHIGVALPLQASAGPDGARVAERSRLFLVVFALMLVAAAVLRLSLQGVVLSDQMGADLSVLFRTLFARSLMVAIGTGFAVALAAAAQLEVGRRALMPLLFLLLLSTASIGPQATAAIDGRWLTVALHALHSAGAGLWLGSLPFVLGALAVTGAVGAVGVTARLCRRATGLATIGFLLTGLGGLGLAVQTSATPAVLFGQAAGVLIGAKAVIAGLIVLIGLSTLWRLRRLSRDPNAVTERVRRLTEVQLLLAIPLLFLAATLATQPIAGSGRGAAVSLETIANELRPRIPDSVLAFDLHRYGLPDADLIDAAVAARDRAEPPWQGAVLGASMPVEPVRPLQLWSEATHHLMGVLLLLLAVVATFGRAERPRAGVLHPAILIAMAVAIVLRADIAVWPLGPLGPDGTAFGSLAEGGVLEHRLIAMVLLLGGVGELLPRLRLCGPRMAGTVGGAAMVAAATLLLVKALPLVGSVRQQAELVVMLPLLVLGLLAGAGRWLEARMPAGCRSFYGRAWPICVFLAGLVLLQYHEA